jgi:3'-phosphoadenosine 5'-phosphosulfate (PAPS) 3'-phosphatase
LLVREAGGLATDMYGDPLRFNNSLPKVRGVLAGAPDAFKRARTRLLDVGGSDRMAELSTP